MQIRHCNTCARRRHVDEKKKLASCDEERCKAYGDARRASMGWPSMEALAMAGADWAEVHAGVDDGEGAPPEHLRSFEAFLEKVVPVDMLLAFGSEEAARARRGKGRRSHKEDVKEKLKLWAKAVARKTRQDI